MRIRWLTLLLAFLMLTACAASSGSPEAEAEIQPTASPTPALQVVIAYVDDAQKIASAIPTHRAESEPTPEPTPEPAPTPEPTPEPTSTPAPTAAPPAYIPPEGVYTIAWISDPQHYSAKFPELYESMTLFLASHREELKLEYIIHTGDLVNTTGDEAQWEVASRAQSYIDDIPNGVLPGNHDCNTPGNEPYWKHFGEKRYKDKPWYGGSYENNFGHYDLLTIGETDYLFVYMGYGITKSGIKWLNRVFEKYPDRIGFLLVHEYFTTEHTLTRDGEKLYKQVVLKHPNLYCVMCGHRYGAYREFTELDDDGDGTPDRTVLQMLFNYQAAGKVGGDGYLRLMQIDEAEGTLHMLTYSPNLDDFNRFDDPAMREPRYEFDETEEEFTVPLPWTMHN